MSQSRMALITFLDRGEVDLPSQGLPGYGRPDNSLPSGPNYPTGGPVLPPGGVTLPVWPFDPSRPDNSLPTVPGTPGNELPNAPVRPENGLPFPGKKYVVKWIACHGLILVPDNSLPETAEPK